MLHKTSYWSSSSVVIVLLHTALFYSNFEILWKFWNFLNLLKILSFWIFLKSYEIFEILWKFGIFKKKIEILRKFGIFKKNWNFKKFSKFSNFFKIFKILWNFLTLISKKQFLCNKKPRNFIHWFCTRVQYDYLLHRNCFLLINMLENGMSRVLLLVNRKTVK